MLIWEVFECLKMNSKGEFYPDCQLNFYLNAEFLKVYDLV